MPIPSTSISVNRSEMFNPVFREVLVKHMPYFNSNTNSIKEVPKALQIRYVGDFYGLLKEQSISYDYWWVIMRYNGMTSPTDYSGAATYTIPSEGEVNSVLRNWNNTYA